MYSASSTHLSLSIMMLFFLSSPSVPGQQVLHTHESVGTDATIDGSVNPELIPDLAAYRLVFISLAENMNPTNERKARQLAFLNKAGIRGNDLAPAIEVLAVFKAKYKGLLATYNKVVLDAESGGPPADLTAFLASRDELVQSTRNSMASLLSSESMTQLDAHVQHEKSKMRVSKEIQ